MVPSARRVLLVDEGPPDDPAVVVIANALEMAGFSVRIAAANDAPTDVAARFRPDLAVISRPADRSPNGSEAAVARTLRTDHGVPVVVVESAVDEPDAPEPDAGHDERIMSRVTASLPDAPPASSTLEAGDVVVDEAGRLALRADEPLDLTRMEFDLLAYLVRNRNRVVSREELHTSVWHGEPVTPNAVEAVVSKLRAKLETHGPRLIHTVRGVGYVLRVEGTSPFDLRRHAALAERERAIRARRDAHERSRSDPTG